ncbi:unnamed protein product [Rotaria sordida]|uniref:Defensin n=1 Tax=Rotaria sordida TaxID=392033 RepID=A0A814MDV1_9BILA|nr:unnamed protein product [Rotaria sordida]
MQIWAIGEFESYLDAILNHISNRMRKTRSFGCNGSISRDESRCRQHCRNHSYKTGFCSPATNYTQCICIKSPVLNPKYSKLLRIFLNVSCL